MKNSATNNKRIAKNTLMLYIRMFLMMAVTLYTSRVVLQQLGVEDFGVYNVVGGTVVLMGFLNSSMSGASSRFLTFDIGKGDYLHLKKVFGSALLIHIIIGLFVLIAGEAFGIWFVNNCLDIPDNRMFAANIVFQFALLSSVVSIIQVPYSATLIAYERIDLYAWIEILNVFLKLGIVFLLSASPFEKLESYSFLIFAVSSVIFLIYRAICVKMFDICKFQSKLHKDIVIPMLSFSGWDLYGNGCVVLRQQGTNIILNNFFGVVVNAASGVATQVSSAISMFVSNITMAIRPQIIKQYAAGNIGGMQKLVSFAIIICLLLVECVMVPVYLNVETIMQLWLVKVPIYAVDFCKLLMIANSIIALMSIWNIVIHASGRIRVLSLLDGTLYLSSLLFVYIALKQDANPNWAYSIWIVIVSLALLSSMAIAKSNVMSMSVKWILKQILIPVVLVLTTIVSIVFLSNALQDSVAKIFIVAVANVAVLVMLLYLFWILPCFKGRIKRMLNFYTNEG